MFCSERLLINVFFLPRSERLCCQKRLPFLRESHCDRRVLYGQEAPADNKNGKTTNRLSAVFLVCIYMT